MAGERLKKRSDKVAYMGVTAADSSDEIYRRMTKFTSMSGAKNAVSYSRRYIDEDFDQTDVTGYSPSISFAFDSYTGNLVHEDLESVFLEEKTGTDAVRSIVVVDFSEPGKTEGTYKATKRDWAVVPEGDGDSTDAYTYSGSFNAKSQVVFGTAKPSADKQTVVFTPDSETPVTSASDL